MREKSQDVPGMKGTRNSTKSRAEGRTQKRPDGSPRDRLCANTGPAAPEELQTIDPVPLYLVPQMVTAAVHRCGEGLSELHVRRGEEA